MDNCPITYCEGTREKAIEDDISANSYCDEMKAALRNGIIRKGNYGLCNSGWDFRVIVKGVFPYEGKYFECYVRQCPFCIPGKNCLKDTKANKEYDVDLEIDRKKEDSHE